MTGSPAVPTFDQSTVSPAQPSSSLLGASSRPTPSSQHQLLQQLQQHLHQPLQFSSSFPDPSFPQGIASANSAHPNAPDAQHIQARLALAQQTMQGLQQLTGQAGIQGVQGLPNGLMNNMHGMSQDQIFNQLQALQTSQRLRLGGQPTGSPFVNGAVPSEATPSDSVDASASSHGSVTSAALAQLTQPQRDAFFAQQRLLQPQLAAATPSLIPNPATPQTPANVNPSLGSQRSHLSSAQAQAVASQKRQFLSSLTSWYKQQNIPLPTEVFNGERDGAIKVAGVWVDLIDLFMVIMRAQGIMNAIKQPPDSPLWQGLLLSKGIPNPLPSSVSLPRPPGAAANVPTQTTTNAVQYLIAVYIAYVKGFENHMQKQRQAAIQRQAGRQTSGSGPADAAQAASTPAAASAPTPQAPTPAAATPVPPQASTMPDALGSTDAAGPSRPAPVDTKSNKTVPAPIDTALASAGLQSAVNVPETPHLEKKRIMVDGHDDPALASVAEETADPSKPPKRKRYKVEYRPIHLPYPTMAGWDERAVRSTFPKNNLQQPTHSIHELGVIDMEAILMGLRSRLPQELGYCISTLSLLSMPHPEDNLDGLPLVHLLDIFNELIDLVEEATFGEDGYEAWVKKVDKETATAEYDLDRLDFMEFEQIGRHTEVDVTEELRGADSWRKEQTGGSTDIVLSALNLVRNFSMFEDNRPVMGRQPRLFVTLSRVIDSRLTRVPGRSSDQPFSMLEHARVRRDVTVILTNVGQHFKLAQVPLESVLAIYRMLAKTVASGFEIVHARDPGYGPGPGSRQVTVPIIYTIYRAAEAFYSIAFTDGNREVLSQVPKNELVSLFESLVKLLPVTPRADEALTSVETHLIYVECLALGLYSLAFLAPIPVRAAMRSIPGAVSVLKRCITNTMKRNSSFKANPHNVLCRRLAEVLGVLNGTVTCAGEVSAGRMSFSAGSGEGKGWRWSAGVVQSAWFADDFERIIECLTVPGVDAHTFGELDAMWWAGGE